MGEELITQRPQQCLLSHVRPDGRHLPCDIVIQTSFVWPYGCCLQNMVIYWSLRKFSRLPFKNMFLYIRGRLPRLLFQFIKHTFKIPL